MSELPFSEQVREKFPEGLTGVFAIGGTRTTYILEHNRASLEPGRIDDFAAHGEFLMHRYWAMIKEFFDLGGQNMIIAAFSYRGFYNRGNEYSTLASQEMLRLGNDEFAEFYRSNDIDPYFVGIDTLMLLPEDSPGRIVGEKLSEFQKSWVYVPGRRKLLWEIASIPLFSMWKFMSGLSAEARAALDQQIADTPNLEDVARILYRHFSLSAFGVEVPMPHFYIGSNKGGDLKLRVPIALSLTGGEYLRLFYTPYPSLFMTHEVLQRVVADVAFKDRFHSAKTDYSGQYSSELIELEYQRVLALSQDAETTVGLVRRVGQETQ